jgi:hypothetical protein
MKWSMLMNTIALLFIACTPYWEAERIEYGSLGRSVAGMPYVMDYVWLNGDAYPPTVSTQEFLDSLRVHMPIEYEALSSYVVEFKGCGPFYVINVYNRRTMEMIMFDYSCTQALDGPVYIDPKKYNHETFMSPCIPDTYEFIDPNEGTP